MVDIFVSYSSEDREQVRPIVQALSDVGWTVWWDREIGAGTAFDREIEKAIDEARCVVVVWTENSVESEWVRTEANEGLEKNILVPVQLTSIKPPLAFRRIQMIDLATGGYDDLTAAIANHVPIPVNTDSDQTPFVGREKELTALQSRLAAAERGEGDFIVLSGEAGVGKSRLVQELAAEARRRQFIVLSGHSIEMEGAPPYQPLIEQIEQAQRVVPTDLMREILGENAPEVSRLMPELRQKYADIPEPAELPPEQERRYLLHGVCQFIDRGAQGQPILMIFEDVHWADSSTCVLLRYLADRMRQSRVLIVATYREAELETTRPFSKTLQDLNRERLIEDIHLGFLDRELVATMLERKAGMPPPPSLTELVFSETEGNPFFIEELYRHLEESGKMFTESGAFAPDIMIADTEVPRGVRLIIGERLEKISDDCRNALTIGAVIGRQFNFEVLLSASTRIDEDDLLDALDEAMEERLVVDNSRDREAIYGFAQEQVRQTLLSALSMPRRQRMHLRIADAIEAYAGDGNDKHVPEIAHHLYQAGAAADEEKTITYLLRAAERAMSAIAYEDGLKLYDSALSIMSESDIERAAKIHTRRAEALQGMEQFDDALGVLKDAIAKLPDGDLKDELILKRCRVFLDIWRGSEAVEDLEALLLRRQQADDRQKELEAQLWVARARYVLSLDKPGFAEKAIDAYEDTIALARELNRPKELCQALTASAQLSDYEPAYYKKAKEHLDEAEKIAESLGSEDLAIEVATMQLNFHQVGVKQVDWGEDVLRRLEARRDPIRLNAIYFRMMWLTFSEAQFHRCIEICDAGTELAYRIGTLPVQYATIKGLALLEMGQFDQAWATIGEEIADEDHRFGAALQQLGWMHCELNLGDFEAAIKRAKHVVTEADALSRVWMKGWVSASFAWAAATPGAEKWLSEIEAVIESTEQSPDTIGRASLALAAGDKQAAKEIIEQQKDRNLLARGVRGGVLRSWSLACIALQLEDWQATCDRATEALAAAQDNDMLPLAWRLLLAMGSAEAKLGDKAASEQHLLEAEQIWEQTANTVTEPQLRASYTQLAEKLGM